MGGLLGHAVRFGAADDVLAAGEGIETMLSLRCAICLPCRWLPRSRPTILTALLLPPTLRRLYIARDADAAGDMALAALTERAEAAGIEAIALSPQTWRLQRGFACIRPRRASGALRIQLAPQDVARFMRQRAARTGSQMSVLGHPGYPARPCRTKLRRPSRGRSRRRVHHSERVLGRARRRKMTPDSQRFQKGHEVLVLLP